MSYRRIKYIAYIIACALWTQPVCAQDASEIIQKWLNYSTMNPAATGSINYFEVSTIARKQWIGMDGTPGAVFLNAQNLFPNISSSAGITVMNDYVGFYNSFSAKIAYAYHIKLGERMSISLGLTGGVFTQGRDNTKVALLDPSDPEYDPNYARNVRPDFDAGIEFRHKGIRIGLSAMHFNVAKYEAIDYSYGRAFNLYGSDRLDLNQYIAIMPTAYLSYAYKKFHGEAGALFYFRTASQEVSLQRISQRKKDHYDRFWLGANFGFEGHLSLLGGLCLTENWRLGYAFGYNRDFSAVRATTTHEILLSWRIKTSQPPRYLCLEGCE